MYIETIHRPYNITDISLSESTKDDATKKCTLNIRICAETTPINKRKIDDNNKLTTICKMPSR